MHRRKMFQTLGTVAYLVFSAGAVFLAYLSYDLSRSADERLRENIGFSRIGCYSSLKVEYEDDVPVALHRDLDAYISSLSVNPVTRVTCYEEGTSTWASGIAGNDRRATTLHTTGGETIELSYEINGGEVITMRQRDLLSLREEAISAYSQFRKKTR